MNQNPWGSLTDLRSPLPLAELDRYVAELAHWNRAIRLVGPKDLPGIRLQVVDAVLPFLHCTPHFPLLDIGSGAGLPGILLALLHPGKEVICLEPRLKRVAFLRHVTRTLGIESVRVVPERSDRALRADPSLAHAMLTVTARAVADVPALLESARPFLARGGRVLLPRGGGDSVDLPSAWKRTLLLSYSAPKPLGSRTVQEFQLA